MIWLRITGSGEPATTTLPSFFAAASVSFHCFCQSADCAKAAGAHMIDISKASIVFTLPPEAALIFLTLNRTARLGFLP